MPLWFKKPSCPSLCPFMPFMVQKTFMSFFMCLYGLKKSAAGGAKKDVYV
jgi:hypothetical protein